MMRKPNISDRSSTSSHDRQAEDAAKPEREVVRSLTFLGNQYVRVRLRPRAGQGEERSQEDRLLLSAVNLEPKEVPLGRRVRTFLFGVPIPTERASNERIGKIKALAVLSSDALSSAAYGTEASLAVLATAGLATLSHNLFIGLIVVALLGVVAFSYRQTIYHYPNGGGSYIVAKDNLNVHFGLVAAAALLIDYVLTVSVSVSAGVDALTSAFSRLLPYNVVIGLAMVAVILLINLRGVRESGTIFAAPTYLFVGSFLLMVLLGVLHALGHGGLTHALPPRPSDIPLTEHLSFFLVLTAFASGCAAMTGTEAISNGVPIFKPRQEKNAAQTLTWMAVLLGMMYAGTTYLSWRYGVTPQLNSAPTVDSQLATIFFAGWFRWFYFVFQFATMLILVLAANTSFADFPRLSSILARDHYLPHFFAMQGDRLAFNVGIIVLGVLSSLLLVLFNGNTDALINLYALGVFVAFTMSQSGMVRRWLRTREHGWRHGLTINALGAMATALVTMVIAVAKFDRGVWVVVILIPALYMLFQAIHHHYAAMRAVAEHIPLHVHGNEHSEQRHLVIVPIASLDRLALRGLTYARALTPYVIAVHVALDSEDAKATQTIWEKVVISEHALREGPQVEMEGVIPDLDGGDEKLLGPLSGPKLIVLDSPYRAVTRPILNFVDAVAREYGDDLITVVLPEFVTNTLWEWALHNQTALRLKLALLRRPQIITANVPYRFGREN
jgi:amino acid transporter